jgi:DNA-binding MarR family transcriptional regulator
VQSSITLTIHGGFEFENDVERREACNTGTLKYTISLPAHFEVKADDSWRSERLHDDESASLTVEATRVSLAKRRLVRRARVNLARGDDALKNDRDNNVRRLLVAATRTLNRRITAELQRCGYDGTRPGHAALLANLDLSGNSVTEIAERAQISKQAMARLAVELEGMGLITREPSRSDGRMLMLRFTRTGKRLVRASVAIVAEFERELTARIGARSLASLKRALAAIAEIA